MEKVYSKMLEDMKELSTYEMFSLIHWLTLEIEAKIGVNKFNEEQIKWKEKFFEFEK